MNSDHHHQNKDDDRLEGSSTTSEDEIEFKTNNSAGKDSKGCDIEGSSGEKLAPSQNHKCEICGKSFSSGKALGGHKRSHVQALKKEGRSNKKGNCYSGSSTTKICYVCKKGFPSKKSMHGHMRSHPEREWRGVLPPDHPALAGGSCFPNSDSDDDDDDDYDYDNDGCDDYDYDEDDGDEIGSRDLPQEWGRYHKRKNSESGASNEVLKAASILMQMSRDKGPQSSQHVKLENGGHYYVQNGENTSFESGDETDSEEEDEEDAYLAKARYMNVALKGKKGTNGTRDLEETVVVVKENNKRKKLVVRIELPNSESKAKNSRRVAKDEYQCDICDKSFSTPQALGGHKSSHYKEKNNKPSSHEAEESSQAGVAREEGARVWDFDLNDTPNVKQDDEI